MQVCPVIPYRYDFADRVSWDTGLKKCLMQWCGLRGELQICDRNARRSSRLSRQLRMGCEDDQLIAGG